MPDMLRILRDDLTPSEALAFALFVLGVLVLLVGLG